MSYKCFSIDSMGPNAPRVGAQRALYNNCLSYTIVSTGFSCWCTLKLEYSTLSYFLNLRSNLSSDATTHSSLPSENQTETRTSFVCLP